ncbi:hypothetical protein RBI94_08590 [Pseudomonas putida]|uniref:hypothetical protein n=1 Tax=Pseudomonas putida TaxID=303 RepID=UPI0007716B73|nr:hypothetical protein [Pseudomonas putida]KWW13227.1 hypothetical protein AS889_16265 [Pseudomonas putida]MDQ2484068.1 hypothetical protein [Pseudomonas putida]
MNSYIVTLIEDDTSPSVTSDESWADYEAGVIYALLNNQPSACITSSTVAPTVQQAVAAVLRPLVTPAQETPLLTPVECNTAQQRKRQQTAQGAPQSVSRAVRVSGGVRWA